MPVDLEWPRRAIVGAIVVIGVTRPASFAEGPACFIAAKRKTPKDNPFNSLRRSNCRARLKSQTIALSSISPSNSGLSVFNPICEAATA